MNNSPLTSIDLFGLIDIDGIYDEESRCARDAEFDHRLKGVVHGTVDFAVETIHGVHTSLSYIGSDGLDLEERRDVINTIGASQTRHKKIIDDKIMETFGIDPLDETYQFYRDNTKLGLEIWSLATGVYGAYKGIRFLNKVFKMPATMMEVGTSLTKSMNGLNTLGAVEELHLNQFHQAASNLSKIGKDNIRILRGWAKSKGWQKVTNSQGGPEIWGETIKGAFEWKLKIKPISSFREGLQSGSNLPRFDARLSRGNYINPFTSNMGARDIGTHIPLENIYR